MKHIIYLIVILILLFKKGFLLVKPGGGVGLYLADSIEFKYRPDSSFSNNECADSSFVEVNKTKEKNLLVGVIYRPPIKQSLQEFINGT